MSRFVVKVLCVVVALLVIDRLLLPAFALRAETYRYDNRFIDFQKRTGWDVVVVGSSRAARNIDSKTLGRNGSMSVYNLGMPGSNLFYHEFIQRWIYSKRIKVSCILYVVDPGMFVPDTSLVPRYDKLLLNCDDDFVVDYLIEQEILPEAWVKVFPSLKYKACFPQALFENQAPGFQDTIGRNGDMLLEGQSNASVE
jgi:hypothetical protein